MATRNIVYRGDPLLTKKSRNVEKFDDRLGTLIDDMIQTMHEKDGVGLAGPQVGILRRVVIVEPEEGKPLALVNPEITSSEGYVEGSEGCLSVPGVWGVVGRPEKVKFHAQDRTGKDFDMEASGFAARIVCHELDHLDGVLFTDKVIRYENEGTEEDL